MSAPDRRDPNHHVGGLLDDWNLDWQLGKTLLHCRHCEGAQTFHGAGGGKPFSSHKPKCPGPASLQTARYPLHELRVALDALTAVPA